MDARDRARAHILLIEAKSASNANLFAADKYAASQGATVISNSWGLKEISTETTYDSDLSTPGVTYVFAAGDSGNQLYASTSPHVLSVGGTKVAFDSNYNWTGEAGWPLGGGGTSLYEAKPAFQSGLPYTTRATPDVSYNAALFPGVSIYDSYKTVSPWQAVGGTSEALRSGPRCWPWPTRGASLLTSRCSTARPRRSPPSTP